MTGARSSSKMACSRSRPHTFAVLSRMFDCLPIRTLVTPASMSTLLRTRQRDAVFIKGINAKSEILKCKRKVEGRGRGKEEEGKERGRERGKGKLEVKLWQKRKKSQTAGAFALFSVSAKASLPISLSPFPFLFLSLPLPFLFLSLRPFVCALKSHSSHLSLK